VIVLLLAIFGCESGSQNSGKSLDNFAAGVDVNINECRAENVPALTGNLQKDRSAFAEVAPLAARAPNFHGIFSSEDALDLSKELLMALTAVPKVYQSSILQLYPDASIHIASNAADLCTHFMTHLGDADRQDLEVDACYSFEQARDGEIKDVRFVLNGTAKSIRHGTVRVIGYFLSQVMLRSGVDKTSGASQATVNLGQDLAKAKAGLAAQFIAEANKVKAFQRTYSPQLIASEQFADYVFAESFDSLHCNNWSPSSQDRIDRILNESLSLQQVAEILGAEQNTRNVMAGLFPRTAALALSLDQDLSASFQEMVDLSLQFIEESPALFLAEVKGQVADDKKTSEAVPVVRPDTTPNSFFAAADQESKSASAATPTAVSASSAQTTLARPKVSQSTIAAADKSISDTGIKLSSGASMDGLFDVPTAPSTSTGSSTVVGGLSGGSSAVYSPSGFARNQGQYSDSPRNSPSVGPSPGSRSNNSVIVNNYSNSNITLQPDPTDPTGQRQIINISNPTPTPSAPPAPTPSAAAPSPTGAPSPTASPSANPSVAPSPSPSSSPGNRPLMTQPNSPFSRRGPGTPPRYGNYPRGNQPIGRSQLGSFPIPGYPYGQPAYRHGQGSRGRFIGGAISCAPH
jgi:hypothetical protein